MKTMDENQTLYHMVNQYPELVDILVQIGFKDVKQPALLNTVGKIMTLKKGAKLKGIPYQKIKEHLKEAGYCIKEENHHE